MHNPASLPSRPVIVGETGSHAHGLNIETSDHDYLGLYTDRPDQLIGLKPLRKGVRKGDQPEGVRLSAGESETTYHAVRKYAALAAQGNPTMLTLLFTPILTVPDEIGLQENRDMFLSKRVARTHVGYADSIIAQLTGKKAPHPYRPELIEKYGWDVKHTMHALRILLQGIELLTTGHMELPMAPPLRQMLLGVRHGLYSKQFCLDWIKDLRSSIDKLDSILPDEPDYNRINHWLIDVHNKEWEYA